MVENEMPCFDPKDVIFITNKWDTIPKEVHGSSDSSEDEETKTWDNLYSTIKQQWPATKDENIFKLNLKDVIPVIFCSWHYECTNMLLCTCIVLKTNVATALFYASRTFQTKFTS